MPFTHYLDVVFEEDFPEEEEVNVLTSIFNLIARKPKTYTIFEAGTVTFEWHPAPNNACRYTMDSNIYSDLAVRYHTISLQKELKRIIKNNNHLWSVSISKPLTMKIALEPEFLQANQLHGGTL